MNASTMTITEIHGAIDDVAATAGQVGECARRFSEGIRKAREATDRDLDRELDKVSEAKAELYRALDAYDEARAQARALAREWDWVFGCAHSEIALRERRALAANT
jgi:hypothetical protein